MTVPQPDSTPTTAAAATTEAPAVLVEETGRVLVITLTERIAVNGPLALAASKRIMAESRSWPAEERFTRQREYVDPVFASEDAQEGARAFTEKRAAQWRGR